MLRREVRSPERSLRASQSPSRIINSIANFLPKGALAGCGKTYLTYEKSFCTLR